MPSATGGEPGEPHLAGITPCGACGGDRLQTKGRRAWKEKAGCVGTAKTQTHENLHWDKQDSTLQRH